MSKENSDWSGRLQRLLLALTLLGCPLAIATGLTRFEVAKTLFLLGLGTLLAITWVFRFALGTTRITLAGGVSAGLGWLFVVYAALSPLWSDFSGEVLREVAFWVVLLAVFTSAACSSEARNWVVVPLVTAGVVVALSVLMQRFGLITMPIIPSGMSPAAGAHGLFDQAVFAGWFLVMTSPLALYGMCASPRPVVGVLFGASGILMGLACATTNPFCAAVLTLSLLLGALLSVLRARRISSIGPWLAVALSLLAIAVGAFAIGELPRREPAAIERLLVDSVWEVQVVEGYENAVTDLDEWAFEWGRSLRVWRQSPIIGHGLGSWEPLAGAMIDPESSYYSRDREEYHIHLTPPGLVLGGLLELGAAGTLLILLFLGGALWSSLRGMPNSSEEKPGGGFLLGAAVASLFVVLFTQGGYHAAQAMAAFAILGLAPTLAGRVQTGGWFSARDITPAGNLLGKLERWFLLAIPVLILSIAGLWSNLTYTVADYRAQFGEQLLKLGRNEQAIEVLAETASQHPNHHRAIYLFGSALVFTPTDEERFLEARSTLERAASMRPHDLRFRLPIIKLDLLRSISSYESDVRTTQSLVTELEEVVLLDPNNSQALSLLADILETRGQYNEAINVRTRLIAQLREPTAVAMQEFSVGNIYEVHLEDPRSAREHYLAALRAIRPGHAVERSINERLAAVDSWLETGAAPSREDPHASCDHSHDHDHHGLEQNGHLQPGPSESEGDERSATANGAGEDTVEQPEPEDSDSGLERR